MNKAKLKSYAPQARKDFIAAVTARAHLLGLSEKGGKCRPSYPDTHKPQCHTTSVVTNYRDI